jgi:hypothetical protein
VNTPSVVNTPTEKFVVVNVNGQSARRLWPLLFFSSFVFAHGRPVPLGISLRDKQRDKRRHAELGLVREHTEERMDGKRKNRGPSAVVTYKRRLPQQKKETKKHTYLSLFITSNTLSGVKGWPLLRVSEEIDRHNLTLGLSVPLWRRKLLARDQSPCMYACMHVYSRAMHLKFLCALPKTIKVHSSPFY